MTQHNRLARWLDFDTECRPLSYWQPDRPTADTTAIASCWIERDKYGNFIFGSMQTDLLGEMTGEEMLLRFVERYNEADGVTGHYIRMHDLPILNGALMELGLPLLGPKLTCDTKLDMMRKADIPATQEYLLETLQVRDASGNLLQKYHMTQGSWRSANRLTPEGLALTRARVSSDVSDHILLREAMLARHMLKPPTVWDPGGSIIHTPGRGTGG